MNYLAIGLVIILVIVLYYTYYYFTNTSLTAGLQDLKKPVIITYEKLKIPNSNKYSYQCWLYISNPTSSNVPVFYRQNGASQVKEFVVDLSGQTLSLSAGKGTNGAGNLKQVMTITNNFPIQQWTYLVVNVYNLQTFEAYINGKLVKTVNVPTPSDFTPSSMTSSLYIGDGKLDGYVTKFIRIEKPLDAQTIWKTYLSGNGLTSYFSSLIPYGLNMSISNGEELQRSIKIF